jgi:hypothetical protein
MERRRCFFLRQRQERNSDLIFTILEIAFNFTTSLELDEIFFAGSLGAPGGGLYGSSSGAAVLSGSS